MAGRRLGVRWSEPGLAEELAALSRAFVAEEDGPANVSVVVGRHDGTVRTKHQIHVQGRFVLATADPGRVLRAVARSLAALATAVPDNAVRVSAVPLVDTDGRVVLVDRRLGDDLAAAEPRLRRHGVRGIDAPVVDVAGREAAVLVPDAGALAGIDRAALGHRHPPTVTDDDLSGWNAGIDLVVYASSSDSHSQAATVAQLTAMAQPAARMLSVDDVEQIVALTDAVDTRAVAPGDRAALERALGVRST